MTGAFRVAVDEWRYWLRSRLAVVGLITVGMLVVSVAILTAVRMSQEAELRQQHQQAAVDRFLSQPDRHPHRMVHYGHYVFRRPGPLSMIDPGVDVVAGTSLFLEGHRQNTATFAAAQAGAITGGLGLLTTALLYQLLIPLLFIALGHGVLVREREAGTLTTLLSMGLSVRALACGKALALMGLVAIVGLPLVVVAAVSVALGEPVVTAAGLLGSYLVYLSLWASAVFVASALIRQRRSVLAALVGGWFTVTLVVPRVGVVLARAGAPADGHIEQSLRMKSELKKAGNPHNPADPAFAKLRDGLLAKYNAASVDQLPVNLRGVVASVGEENISKILRRNAEHRMTQESDQLDRLSWFGWLSPTVSLALASRALAGTDLSTHHRFLTEGETLRFDFVQALNRLHTTELAYADDAQRSRDPAAEKRTRISADNWSLLKEFDFKLTNPSERLSLVRSSWLMLCFWALAMLGLSVVSLRGLQP